MTTSIAELLPTISDLSPADKFQLVQIVLQQLAAEQGIKTPKKSLRGTLKQYANPSLIEQESTAWLNAVGDNHEPS
jgi:hypothetical protein